MIINEKDCDKILRLTDNYCASMMEAGCDSVQVVATAHAAGDEWTKLSRGKGNIFARMGAVKDWLDGRTGETLANEIANATGEE